MVRDVAKMKAKTDRIEAMLLQARMEGVQVEGGMRAVIREEVQRQLRSVSARSTKTHNLARRSSAGLSSSSRHSHAARRRQVSYNA
jgi:hypothetical protein